ncbi:MAG: HAD-IIB family hydrolase [Pseudomonadota bacterium]
MEAGPRLIVFTDLDGTLLDHHTYCWDAAQCALDGLAAAGCGLVLASSKTAAEIAPLRRALGFDGWPAIVENGAGLLPEGSAALPDAAPYGQLRAALDALPTELRASFRGFGDVTAEEVARWTGLPLPDAKLAQTRAFSEPGQWSGSDPAREAFVRALADQGIIAQHGGRFLTLSFGGNKADQVRALVARYRPRHTLALGDAPNDIEMLSVTDRGVIIPNPEGRPIPPLRGERLGRITRGQHPGPTGWNSAVLALIDTLDLHRTPAQ